MTKTRTAKFQIGQIVRHRIFSFRGVIFDIDPEFNNTEEWWLSIPEDVRPHKDQPFYHLLADKKETLRAGAPFHFKQRGLFRGRVGRGTGGLLRLELGARFGGAFLQLLL